MYSFRRGMGSLQIAWDDAKRRKATQVREVGISVSSQPQNTKGTDVVCLAILDEILVVHGRLAYNTSYIVWDIAHR